MARRIFTYEGKKYDLTAKNQEELAIKVAMRKRDIDEGKVAIGRNMLVKVWFKEFMKIYKEKSISPETYDDYLSRANSKILPLLGSMQIKDVRPVHCQRVLNEMSGYSKTYISKTYNTMYQMFKRAEQNKLILSNPAADLEMPEAEDGTHRAITDAEREITYKVAETHRGGLWVLTMLLTGMRPSETASLQGRHLDFKCKSITVEGAIKKKDSRIGKTKTKSGNRSIPMPEELFDKYKALKLGPFDYVFKNEDGGHLSKTNMGVMWRNFKREMNISMGCTVERNKLIPVNERMVKKGAKPIYLVADDLVPYCYRHTFCTDLEAAGVSLNEAARMMGHKNIAITAKIYTHASQASFDRVSEQINAYRNKAKVGVRVGASPVTVAK